MPLAGQEALDGIAAMVGEKIILKSDVLQLANMAAIQRGINLLENPAALEAYQGQALQSLVTQSILVAQAKIDSLDDIPSDQVDQALEQQIQSILAQVGSEDNFAEAVGQSLREFRRDRWETVRDRLIAERYQQEKFNRVTISRPEVESFFQAYKDSIPSVDTRVELSQITYPIQAGPDAKEKALGLITDLRQQILSGTDFSTLAIEHSADPVSASRGGELGFVRRGDLVPEFEQTAFNLEAGEISDIVATVFGFHIMELIARQGEKINVRHILISATADAADRDRVLEEVRKAYFMLVEEPELFDSLALRASTSSNGAAKTPYLGWIELSRLPSDAYRSAVFGANSGDITPPFETEDGFHLLKILDIKKGGPPNLVNYYPQIEKLALQQKQFQYLEGYLERVRNRLFIKILL